MNEFQQKLIKKLDLLADQQHIIISKLDEIDLTEVEAQTEQTARAVNKVNRQLLKGVTLVYPDDE